MKNFKAIIFDMDGTIVDTAQIWHMCNKMFLINRNIYTDELFKKLEYELHGLSIHKGVHIVKAVCNLLHVPDQIIIEEFERLGLKYYELEIAFIKECENFMLKLIRHDIPMAIATNADDYGIRKVDSVVDLKKYFRNHMYGISCVNNVCKPSPDIFLYAANKLKINPEDCIAIEDSLYGVTASKSAGMFTLGINTAGKPEMLSGADKIINCYSEINLSDYFNLKI
jgi:HAD superfamily hydrolase (TIGR01509 family)